MAHITKPVSYYVERNRHRSRKSRQPEYFECFYTGMILPKEIDPYSGHTIEHLIPKTALRGAQQTKIRREFDRIQQVDSVSIINHLIGHAPLRVKYELRDYLARNRHPPILTTEERLEWYVRLTRKFLDGWRIRIPERRINHLPWYYRSMAIPEDRAILHRRYIELLTDEELRLIDLREWSYEQSMVDRRPEDN
jgi:hypothetical protein